MELKDVLTLPENVAEADLNVGSVHLYHYDGEAENHCGQEINPARYSYVYDRDSHTLTFTLPDSMAMVLVYEYTIDRGNAAGSLNLSNSAQLTGVAGSETGNNVQFQETSSSASVSKRTLTIYKVDGDNYGKSLPGAKFRLEYWKKGTWKQDATFTTDEDGKIVLDMAKEDGTAAYQTDTLYKLTETNAPSGYAPDLTPRYFVWIGDEGLEATKQAMQPVLEAAQVSETDVLFIANSSALYVPNTSTTLTVQKVWVDENGEELQNPGVEQVKVKLWQQPMKSNAVTVTVFSQGNQQQDWIGDPVTKMFEVANGGSLTIQITGVYDVNGLTIKVNGASSQTVIPQNQVCTYTIHNVTEGTRVEIHPANSNQGNTFGNINELEKTEPYYIPDGEKTVFETVCLTADNGWSHTWPSLPAEVDGKPVYYTVEETAIPGFHVSYSPNNTDGIQTGELVITNQSNGYVLPETGGSGIFLFTSGGMALTAAAAVIYIILRRKEDAS